MPEALVMVERWALVAVLVMTTCAPATTAPVGSVTVPVSPAVGTCAHASRGNRVEARKRRNIRTSRAGLKDPPQAWTPALQFQTADYADVIAVPHHALPDGHAVRQRIAVGQLNFLDNFARI